jgi:hypothetical protein|nr:MAG TPA: Protein of unknown function (DUF3109) [Caudoviricetes sp.]
MKIKTFQPTEVCAQCKGDCCKTMGCHYSPTDLDDLSFEGLKSEIEKGKISIDWWSGDEHEYYLRARHVGAPIVDPSWGGRCINLTETGCSLPWEKRPLGGRALKPKENSGNRKCRTFYSKEQSKNDWKPYSNVLKQLVEYFWEDSKDETLSEWLSNFLKSNNFPVHPMCRIAFENPEVQNLYTEIAAVSSTDFSDKLHELIKASAGAYGIDGEKARLESIKDLLCCGVDQEEVLNAVKDRNETALVAAVFLKSIGGKQS